MVSPKKQAITTFGTSGITMFHEVQKWLKHSQITKIKPASEEIMKAVANKRYKDMRFSIDRIVTLEELPRTKADRLVGVAHQALRKGATKRSSFVPPENIKALEEIFTKRFLFFSSIDDKLCTSYLHSIAEGCSTLPRECIDRLLHNFRQLYLTSAWVMANGKPIASEPELQTALEFQKLGFPLWRVGHGSPPDYTIIVSSIPAHLKHMKRD